MSGSLEDLRLTLEDLEVVAEVGGIKYYEGISKDELLSLIIPSKKKQKKVKKQKQVFLKQDFLN